MTHTSQLDVVLVKPGSQRALYGELSAFDLTAIEPPLWAALLAAYLRQRDYQVQILDAEVEGLDHQQTARRVAELAPRLALITVSGTNPSASTMNMTGAGAILQALREEAPGMASAMFGLHPSALPHRTMVEEPVDFVCQGEGFATLPPLLDALRHGARPGGALQIPGLWTRRGDEVLAPPPAPLMQDLDSLPMPAWDLLPMTDYRAHNWHCFDDIQRRQPYGVIYTSLGCPYRCSFCCINALFGKAGIRYRSPALVLDEIDLLVQRHGVRNIKIIDEMFVLKKAHVEAICDGIIERGHDLNIWAYARVNTVDAAILAKMKRAGINWLAYGFESGSERVLKGVAKGYKLDRAAEVVRMTHAEGIQICANFIFGLPDDDQRSMQQTLDLALEFNAAWANLYSTMAYPGSRLYEQALEQGLPLPETWQGYSQYSHDCLPLPTQHLSGEQVLAFRDHAFDVYYNRPAYLESIQRTFGQAATDHIRAMSARKLQRRHVPPQAGA